MKRAAELAGGERQLALLLKVTPSHLRLWMMGFADPPGDVFLRTVDVVLQHALPAPKSPGDPEAEARPPFPTR